MPIRFAWTWCFTAVFTATLCAQSADDNQAKDAQLVDRLITQWTAPGADRDTGEAALQLLIPIRAFPLFEKAIAHRKDLTTDTRDWLRSIDNRLGPLIEIRTRRLPRIEAAIKWRRRMTLDCYERIGQKNAKWDQSVRDAFTAYSASANVRYDVFDAADKAIQLGSHDPMVLYIHARAAEIDGRLQNMQIDQEYASAVQSLQKSGYAPYCKALAAMRYAAFRLKLAKAAARAQGQRAIPPADLEPIKPLAQTALELWPQVVQDGDMPTDTICDFFASLLDVQTRVGQDRKGLFDQTYPALEAARPNRAETFECKGRFFIDYAWDARGNGTSDTVPPGGFELMHARLGQAKETLENAWGIDPNYELSALDMLIVAKGLEWPVPQMEQWYQRVMDADPDNWDGCLAKLDYLAPKWQGSLMGMIAFATDCYNTHNWVGQRPFVMPEAFKMLATQMPQPDQMFHTAWTWNNVLAAYKPYLAVVPGDWRRRSEFCWWACRTGHLLAANKQFAILGDHICSTPFGGIDAMEEMRRKAQQAAAAHAAAATRGGPQTTTRPAEDPAIKVKELAFDNDVKHAIDRLHGLTDSKGPFTPDLYARLVARLKILDQDDADDRDLLAKAAAFAQGQAKPEAFVAYLQTALGGAARPPSPAAVALFERARQCAREFHFDQAMDLYHKALDGGHAKAAAWLGACYRDGTGVSKSADDAVKWFRTGAQLGDGLSMADLGFQYLKGEGVPKDPAEGIRWIRNGIHTGDPDAACTLGNAYYWGFGIPADYRAAMKWYPKAADAGSSDAMYSVGIFYQSGLGVAKDDAQALTWFRKAADAGSGDALAAIGLAYENASGVSQDYAEAMKWFHKAANAGSSVALNDIGCMYFYGWSVERDYLEAMKWFRKAVDAGDADATCQIAWLYQNGFGVEQDAGQAVSWFRKGADAGSGDAMNNLGMAYTHGVVVPNNLDEALKWFLKGADAGNAAAMNNLGCYYRNGFNGNMDFAQALKWFHKAADAANNDAMKNLGDMYDEGMGVPQGEDQATQWFRKAADAGNQDAKKWLALHED